MHQIIREIECELDMAEEYIERAIEMTDDARDLYKSIAKEEISHAEKLMDLGNKRCVNDPDKEKEIIWKYEIGNFITKIMKLRTTWSLIS